MKPELQKLKDASLTKAYDDAMAKMSQEEIIKMLSEIQFLKKQIKTQSDVIDRLKQEAHQDPLTKLPNRRLFERELEHALAYFKRYRRTGAVLIVDANDFKAINDSLGHLAGDAVLNHISRLLEKHTRSADTVARIGGDEFAIIMREVSGEQALKKAKKLADLIAQTPCFYEGREVYTSVSIGGCCFTQAESKRDIMLKADSAMYHSKNNTSVSVA